MQDITILLPNILPYGRQQPLGCQWWSKKPQSGGMPHKHYMGFVHRTFSLLPLTPTISRSSDRRRHWPWPGHCRPVQRCPEPRQASYAEPSGSSNSAWPLWWPSMGMMLWKPPCWGLLRKNQDPPPLWKRRPPLGKGDGPFGSVRPYQQTCGNPQGCRTWWADYHPCYLCCTPQSSFLEGKEAMERDWHQSQ